MNNGAVLVVVEVDKEKFPSSMSLECVTAGREIADAWGANLFALIIGYHVRDAAEAMRFYGLDAIYMVDQDILRHFNGELYAEAVKQAYEKIQPKLIIMANTLNGSELGARVGFALDAGVVTGCAGIEMDHKEPVFLKSVYSSNVMAPLFAGRISLYYDVGFTGI